MFKLLGVQQAFTELQVHIHIAKDALPFDESLNQQQ